MSEEEYREHCNEICCFGLSPRGVCTTLRWDMGPSVDDCMKCHFRKQYQEQTNGVTYPYHQYRNSPGKSKATGLSLLRKNKTVDILDTVEQAEFSYCEGCRYLSGAGNMKMCIYRLEKGMRRPCRKGECKDYGIYERPDQRLNGWSKVHAKQWSTHLKQQAKENDDALLSWEPDEDDTSKDVRHALDALAEEKAMEERT